MYLSLLLNVCGSVLDRTMNRKWNENNEGKIQSEMSSSLKAKQFSASRLFAIISCFLRIFCKVFLVFLCYKGVFKIPTEDVVCMTFEKFNYETPFFAMKYHNENFKLNVNIWNIPFPKLFILRLKMINNQMLWTYVFLVVFVDMAKVFHDFFIIEIFERLFACKCQNLPQCYSKWPHIWFRTEFTL